MVALRLRVWQVAEADGNWSHIMRCADTLNEPMEFVTMSIEPNVDQCAASATVHTGGTRTPAETPDGQTEVSNDRADASRGLTDAPAVLNSVETAGLGCDDRVDAKVHVDGVRYDVEATRQPWGVRDCGMR